MAVFSIIGQIIGQGLRFGAALVERMNLPEQRRKDCLKAQDKSDAENSAVKTDIETSVRTGNKDAVNRKLTDILSVGIVCVMLGTYGCFVCSCKHLRPVVYVPADREVSPMVSTNGVHGWFVPDATMNDFIRTAQHAKDLDKEQAVTARMEGKK